MCLFAEVHEKVAGLLAAPLPGGMRRDAKNADAPGRVLDHGQDVCLGAAGQAGREGVARQDRVGLGAQELRPGRPGSSPGGPVPLALRISHTAGAATLTPRPASSRWILRYPHSGGSRASRRTSALMFRRVAGRPGLPRMGRAAQRRRAMSRRQRAIVSGVTSSRSPGARFRYHAEHSREQGPVRPVQLRAARLPPLQDGDLAAQKQDLGGLPRLLAPGKPQPCDHPRDQEEDEPRAHDR